MTAASSRPAATHRVISRLVSFEHPVEIKPEMVFVPETFWPSTDGWSAARIEEEIVVLTPTGHEVITRFPAEQRLVARALLHGERTFADHARDRSFAQRRVLEMIETSAETERVGVPS